MTPEQRKKLETLYQERLRPAARKLEPLRIQMIRDGEKLKKTFLTIALIGLVLAGIRALDSVYRITSGDFRIAVGLVVMGLLFFFRGRVSLLPKLFRKHELLYPREYKSTIVKPIGEIFCDELHYSHRQMVNPRRYEDSVLFRSDRAYDRYQGEDFFSGRIGETCFEFSEIHTQTVSTGPKGKKSYRTVFRGVLFVAQFNKSITGRVTILPDRTEAFLGDSARTLQRVACNGLIELEDPEFESRFRVQADDPVEARYMLSANLMKRIVEFSDRRKVAVRLSFVGNILYLALPTRRDLFDPPDIRVQLTREQAIKHAEEFEFVLGIVEELNLNNRIWKTAA